MKGSVWKKRDKWVVGFYHNEKRHQITKHWITREAFWTKQHAQKALAEIQAALQAANRGEALFDIDFFTGKKASNFEEFFKEWMEDVIEPDKKPATIDGYWSYYRTWLKPFFDKHPVMIHEIKLPLLIKLNKSIKLTGKGSIMLWDASTPCLTMLGDQR